MSFVDNIDAEDQAGGAAITCFNNFLYTNKCGMGTADKKQASSPTSSESDRYFASNTPSIDNDLSVRCVGCQHSQNVKPTAPVLITDFPVGKLSALRRDGRVCIVMLGRHWRWKMWLHGRWQFSNSIQGTIIRYGKIGY